MNETILGLTCISEQLKDKDKKKYSFQTMTRKRFNDLCVNESRDEAIDQLSERIIHNIRTTQYILRHCITNNIVHYRLSSALFPLLTDPTLDLSLESLPNYSTIKHELRFAGLIAFSFKMSISIHPDQFNVLASTNEMSVAKSIKELNFQSDIMDMMGLPQDHTAPMNIHINCTPPEIESNDDPDVVKNVRIKGCWNVDYIIKFSEYIFKKYGFNLPICYDNLHDFCNPSEELNTSFQAERCAYTWVNPLKQDDHFVAPVFHWSEGKPEKPRAHADYFALGNFPPHIAIDPKKPVKWECEVKQKDKAISLLKKNLQQI